MEAEPKMIGTPDDPVQIDESFFSGRRKYGRGPLLQGNINQDDNGALPEWGEDDDPATYGIDDPKWCWVQAENVFLIII